MGSRNCAARLCAIIAAATAALIAVRGAHAQTTYLTRFMEEIKRVVPPQSIPAPTAEDLSARPGPKALPIDIEQAKRLMGLDRLGPNVAARLPGGKLGIVDLGFRGLREWLATHPAEAKLVTYHGPGGLSDQALSDPKTLDHGYWVYRVARAVLPGVPVHLYPVKGDDVDTTVTPIIMGAAGDGVVVFNMSLGLMGLCSLYEEKEDKFSRDLRLALAQREAYLFVSVGNSRSSTHTWISADRNSNGYVDLRTAADAARLPGSSVDGERVMLQPGDNEFYFSWDARNHPQDDYALELAAPNGKQLASGHFDKGVAPGACMTLHYAANRAGPALLRVKRLAGAPSGTLMRLNAYGRGNPVDFNGIQTALPYTFRDNPFVIFVGSFGRTTDGKLAPSPFSDIGRTADGRLVPDILGPGQLLIDGKEHDGTSFASPFLTALYATRVGYNLKNLVERTGGFGRFASGVAPGERARFGIPDADKVTEQLRAITGPTTVSGVSHAVEGGQLVVHFTIERCCMQSLVWYPAVVLTDAATGQPLKDASGKPLVAFQETRTEESGQVKTPVTLRFPIAALEAFKGKPIKLHFGARVRSWSNPPPGSITVDNAPDYRFTL